MNITILSGGSGNESLLKGLLEFYPQANIKIIVNAYDDGKSTGVCRRITNTLGVSDIRKNHLRMYRLKNEVQDNRIIEFYKERYDLPKNNEKQFVSQKLQDWGLTELSVWSDSFFDSLSDDASYDLTDFSIANICYAEMYKNIGYVETNKYFCKKLNIDDCVILNSFDNVSIQALTTKGELIDEANIVCLNNANEKIVSISYKGDTAYNINPEATKVIDDSDLIIISTGTFWSSIYPTLHYGELFRHINNSKAKKVWIMNNEEDKDAISVCSNDFIDVLSSLGVNLSDFCIIQNSDACESLRLHNDDFFIYRQKLGNINGQHHPGLLAKAIFSYYYSFPNQYDYILLDFDDTIWSRDYERDPELLRTSISNVSMANKHNVIIISGNNYDSIKSKIFMAIGTQNSQRFDLWCDANAIQYCNGTKTNYVESLNITSSYDKVKRYINDKYGIIGIVNCQEFVTCLKIKPLDKLVRKVLCKSLNDFVLKEIGAEELEARMTGKTTIDIVKKSNNKSIIYTKLNLANKKTLYIGDECIDGNDFEISKKCNKYINVRDIYETNVILKLL